MRRSGFHRQKRFGNRGTGSQYIRTPTNINATRMMLAVRAIKSYTVAVLLPARLHRAAQSRSGGAGRLAHSAHNLSRSRSGSSGGMTMAKARPQSPQMRRWASVINTRSSSAGAAIPRRHRGCDRTQSVHSSETPLARRLRNIPQPRPPRREQGHQKGRRAAASFVGSRTGAVLA